MFRTDLLSIIRSFDTVFTATGVCHTIYVDCLLADSYAAIVGELELTHVSGKKQKKLDKYPMLYIQF
jgi:hypothetical protein